ncbi:MAG: phosphopantetheine adenylyltransferase [bacterium]|nr:phosphopantetheine adenylyltransferase [bacterium]
MGESKVIVGGTFDFLHAGHRALLSGAFSLGDVTIGLVSNEMAERLKNREVGKYKDRQKELESWIKKPAIIVEINDKFGPTLKEDFDYIVVSPETYETAVLINQERQKLNKKPMEIVKVEFVLAEDGKPISSTRIFNGGIDGEGKLLR